MRRHDREVTSLDEIMEIIGRCDTCRVAITEPDGVPYILPLSFGVERQGDRVTFYFHSALEGKKLQLITEGAVAAFELDTDHQLEYIAERGYCTFHYASVMGRGRLHILPDEQKHRALTLLMRQYHPDHEAWFNPASMARTLVYSLEVEQITAKRHVPKGSTPT